MATVLTFLYVAQQLVGQLYDQTHVELRRLRNVFAFLLVLFVVTIVVGAFFEFQTKVWVIPLIVLPGSLMFLWSSIHGVPFVAVVGSIVLSARRPANNATPPATVPTTVPAPVSNTNIVGDVFDAAVVYGRFVAAILGSMLAISMITILLPLHNAPYLSMLLMVVAETFLASYIWEQWESEQWRAVVRYVTWTTFLVCLAIILIPESIMQGMMARLQVGVGDERDQVATGVSIVDSFLNLLKGDSGLQPIIMLVFAVGGLSLLFKSKGTADFIKNIVVLIVVFVLVQWFSQGKPLDTLDYAACRAREMSLKVKIDCDTPGWEDRAKEVMEKRRLAGASASPVASTTGAASASTTTPPVIGPMSAEPTTGYTIEGCVVIHNQEVDIDGAIRMQELLAGGCKTVGFVERARKTNIYFYANPCPDKELVFSPMASGGFVTSWISQKKGEKWEWFNLASAKANIDPNQVFALGHHAGQDTSMVMVCK